MNLQMITDRVFYLPFEPDTDRPNLFYVKGDAYSLAIDAGNSKAHVDKFYRAILDMGFRLPDYTVITHWHWDHTFGMHAVHGKTITGWKTHEKLLQVMGWEWTEEAMRRRLESGAEIAMCDRDIRLEYPDRTKIKVVTADIVFQGKMTLDLGSIHCDIKQMDAPHSRDSVAIYLPQEKMLAIGDADGGDYYENEGRYDPVLLKNMLDMVAGCDFETYLIGHDHPQSRAEALMYLQDEYDKCQGK